MPPLASSMEGDEGWGLQAWADVLCDPGQIPSPLRASVFPSVQMGLGWYQPRPRGSSAMRFSPLGNGKRGWRLYHVPGRGLEALGGYGQLDPLPRTTATVPGVQPEWRGTSRPASPCAPRRGPLPRPAPRPPSRPLGPYLCLINARWIPWS